MYSWEIDYGADGTIDVETELSSLEDASYIIETSDLGYGDKVSVSLLVQDPATGQCDWPCIIEMDGKKVPLGGTYTQLEGECFFKVYVPTKYGGKLVLTTDGGQLSNLVTPYASVNDDAFTPHDVIDVQQNPKHGWYFFTNEVQVGNVLSATLNQDVTAVNHQPWNYYFWSNLDSSLTLYSESGTETPLKKYDEIFGTNARAEEANDYIEVNGAQHSITHPSTCAQVSPFPVISWHGHCQGMAVASVLYKQPEAETMAQIDSQANAQNIPIFNQQTTLTQEEIEGLYGQVYESAMSSGFVSGYVDHWASQAPPVVSATPQSVNFEIVDRYCGQFHKSLEKVVAGQGRPLYANLRSKGLSTDAENWNNAIYSYVATYEEVAGNELVNKVIVTIIANDGENYPSIGLTAGRTIIYEYDLLYESSGEPNNSYSDDINQFIDIPEQNWISVSGDAVYTPGHVAEYVDSEQLAINSACNSEVGLQNVLILDSQN